MCACLNEPLRRRDARFTLIPVASSGVTMNPQHVLSHSPFDFLVQEGQPCGKYSRILNLAGREAPESPELSQLCFWGRMGLLSLDLLGASCWHDFALLDLEGAIAINEAILRGPYLLKSWKQGKP